MGSSGILFSPATFSPQKPSLCISVCPGQIQTIGQEKHPVPVPLHLYFLIPMRRVVFSSKVLGGDKGVNLCENCKSYYYHGFLYLF